MDQVSKTLWSKEFLNQLKKIVEDFEFHYNTKSLSNSLVEAQILRYLISDHLIVKYWLNKNKNSFNF